MLPNQFKSFTFTKCTLFLNKVFTGSSCALLVLLAVVRTLNYTFGDLMPEKTKSETICVLWGVSATAMLTATSCYFALGEFLSRADDSVDVDKKRASDIRYIAKMTFGITTCAAGVLASEHLERRYELLVCLFHFLPFICQILVFVGFTADLVIAGGKENREYNLSPVGVPTGGAGDRIDFCDNSIV